MSATTRAALARSVRVDEIMGMPISIHVLNESGTLSPTAERAVEACFAELRDIDRVFSTYRDDSDICRIARGELDFAHADPRVADVEAACRAAAIETGGLFSAAWHGTFDPTGYVKGWSVENAARRHLAPLLEREDVREREQVQDRHGGGPRGVEHFLVRALDDERRQRR